MKVSSSPLRSVPPPTAVKLLKFSEMTVAMLSPSMKYSLVLASIR